MMETGFYGDVAVLIPCYNEAVTIAKVIDDFKRELPGARIYVYDNNSSDGTGRIAEEHGAIVRVERRQGKGNVVRQMLRDIDARYYVMVDGDDTYPAENAREMVDGILSGRAHMVIGDRLSSTYFTENKRPFHNMGNRMVRGLIDMLFKSDIQDIMTGYRAFSFEFVKTFPVLSKGFEIETEMTIHALDKKMGTMNVVVTYRDRPEGSISKLNTYSDGFKVMKTIWRLFKNYRPLAFFGIISLVLLLVAAGFMIPVLAGFFETGKVDKFPTLIVCGFLALTAIISYFGGLILSVFTQQQKQSFELRLNEMRQWKNLLMAADRDES